MELLRAGTRFRLRFELLINEQKPKKMSWAAYDRLPQNERDVLLDKRRKELYTDLAVALQGFERGEIGLGARKRRGFGRCQVSKWQMRRYDLTTPEGLLAWLSEGRAWQECPMVLVEEGNSLAEILGVSLHDTKDKRHRFEIEARFALDGSLQVRSGFGQADQGPDMEHLHRPLYDESDPSGVKREPVLPGTSLAGVLRARAVRIANTLTDDEVKAQTLVSKLFGVGPEDVEGKGQDEKALQASRLVVHEVVVRGARPLVQTRIRVDRFTGGAMDNFLFNEAPVFGGEDSRLTLELTVRDPRDYEIGLLLLLLKDLWTGDLPVGGESSVGRGRLKGKSADLIHVQEGETTTWQITQGEDRLEVASRPEPDDVWQSLETYVQALNEHLAGR
jgi:CRISPR/Cas system CSM-associated protein Csm3 (group 7 of RAMP superfamily)